MTVAVCWKCGEMKWGAFNPCPKCQASPTSEEDMAISVAMCDHYFDRQALERMGADIAAGKPLQLAPEARRKLVRAVHGARADLPPAGNAARAPDIECEPARPRGKPWWKKIFGK